MGGAQDFRRLWGGHVPGLLSAEKRYAVLCPLVEKPDGLHILLEVRAAGLKQAGEVCFPGGRAEHGESPEDCALRETFEELSVPPAEIEVIGKTDFLCQPGVSLLQPVIGLLSPAGFAAVRPSETEVAEVFTVPLDFFLTTPPALHSYELRAQVPEDFPYGDVGISRDYRWSGGRAEVPVWHYGGHVIWGLTARILLDIVRRLNADG